MSIEELLCERTVKVSDLISLASGRLNKWFNMYREIDNQLITKVRIETRLHTTDVFNFIIKSLDSFD